MKTVTIYMDDYISLLVQEETLTRLERGGVDNWVWYHNSLSPEKELTLAEFETDLKEQLKNAHNERSTHE